MGYSTVLTIIHETCAALWKALQPMVMPKPTRELWESIEKDFNSIWNFPNCIGAIDGKHVNIRAPWNSGSLYFNYKKHFSTVLLAIVDAKYRFVVVDIGSYGRNSDGGILSNSKLGVKLQNNQLGIPPNKCLPGTTCTAPHVFVGDEAFPLSQNIMRPFPGGQVSHDPEKKIYNYRLSRARRIVESAFGIMQQKFEIFQKRIRIQPKYLNNIILACTCLHNYMLDDIPENISLPRDSILQNLLETSQTDDEEPLTIRNIFKNYFNSTNGSVYWQNDMIERC